MRGGSLDLEREAMGNARMPADPRSTKRSKTDWVKTNKIWGGGGEEGGINKVYHGQCEYGELRFWSKDVPLVICSNETGSVHCQDTITET